MATAPPYDAESSLIGCVVCGYSEGTDVRIFSCDCRLPIHDACIPDWREKGGMCPFCEQVWIVATPMPIRLYKPKINCYNVVLCGIVIAVCMILAALAISLYFYAKRLGA